MKTYCILFSSLLLSFCAFSQSDDIAEWKMGPEQVESSSEGFIVSIENKIGDSFIAKRQIGPTPDQTYTLDKIGKDMKVGKSLTVCSKEKRENGGYEFIAPIFSKNYLFTLDHKYADKKTGIETYLLREVNPETMKYEDNSVSIDLRLQTPSQSSMRYGTIPSLDKKKLESGENGHSVSDDGSKILIYDSEFNIDSKSKEVAYFFVYDENLNELWQKKLTLKYESQTFRIVEAIVDNEGNAHLLGIEFHKRGNVGYSYRIISCLDNGTEIVDNVISLDHYIASEIRIKSYGNSLIVSGILDDDYGRKDPLGYFYSSSNINSPSTDQLITKEFKSIKIKGLSSTDKDVFEYCTLVDILPNSDGNSTLLLEQVAGGPGGRFPGPYSTAGSKFHHRKILVMKLLQNGDVEWVNFIEKQQYYSSAFVNGGNASSFVYSLCNGSVYVLFNENSSGPMKDGTAELYKSYFTPKSNVAIVEIDEQGNKWKEILHNRSSKKESVFIPKVSQSCFGCEILLLNKRKKVRKFSSVNIK